MRIWCEHCQDHYEGDHYDPDSGEHRVGQEYGWAGVSLDAEQIVRALAAVADPSHMDGGWCGCLLCEATYYSYSVAPDWHEPTCPWRLAREWVAANPTVVVATASAPLLEDNPPTN